MKEEKFKDASLKFISRFFINCDVAEKMEIHYNTSKMGRDSPLIRFASSSSDKRSVKLFGYFSSPAFNGPCKSAFLFDAHDLNVLALPDVSGVREADDVDEGDECEDVRWAHHESLLQRNGKAR